MQDISVNTGSPFILNIIEGLRATASGDGLRIAAANKVAYFRVNVSNLGEANLSVKITCEYDIIYATHLKSRASCTARNKPFLHSLCRVLCCFMC